METPRERNLKAGLPYIRQVVFVKGRPHTVMVYDLCSIPNVQLAPGVHDTAFNWRITDHPWVPYADCSLNATDQRFVDDWRRGAVAAQEGQLRKPMPPPTKVHKRKNREPRSKVKAQLKNSKR